MTAEALKPRWDKTNQFRALRATYEAETTRLLGKPETVRDHVPPDLLAQYDLLHAPSTPRNEGEILDAIESLQSIDGPRPGLTIPDGKVGHYISGLLASLRGSLGQMAHEKKSIAHVSSVEERRAKIIEDIAKAKSDKILMESGEFDPDFIKRYPNHTDYLDGYIEGFEWALGRRVDLGVNIQGEIDRFPNHPLRTPDPQES